MRTALMRSTQYQVNLSITINVNADRTLLFIAACVALVTFLVARPARELALLWADFTEATRFTNTIFAIGIKALAFGMGVNV